MSLRAAASRTALTRLLRASAALGLALAVGTCGGDGPTGIEVSTISFGTQQSGDVVAGAPITVSINAMSPTGDVVRSYSGNVMIAITPGTGTPGATLLGPKNVAAVNGVATFSNLGIDRVGAGYTLTASAPNLPPVTGTPFNIVPGPLHHFDFTVLPGNTIVAGAPIVPAIEVTARDAFGNTVTAYAGNVTLTLATAPVGATLSGATTMAAAAGVTTFGGLSVNKSGTYTFNASGGGVTSPSAGFTVVAGPASQLAFSVEPSNEAAGAAIAPAVVVEAQDQFGNRATSFVGSVTVALAANPGNGTLSGTPTVGVASGAATFANLSINRPGSGYTLTAAAGGLPNVISVAFDISTAPVSKLVFAAPVSASVMAGAEIAPPVQVIAQDALGNTVTDFTDQVTVALGTNPNGGALLGTKTVAAVNGVATFTTLSVDEVGNGYALAATSGTLTPGASTAFSVAPAPATQLAFKVQPANAMAGVPIAPAVEVSARDQFGNVDTAFTGNVTVALAGPAGGALSGTATVAALNGVATFSTLSVDKAGGGYSLTASAGALTPAPSAAFAVTAGPATALFFTVDPASARAGDPIAPPVQVTARDAYGNTATAFTDPVTVAIANNPGTGVLGGTTTESAVAGIAIFVNLSVDKAGNGYTLSAGSGALAGDTSAPFDISSASATHFAFTVPPVSTTAGQAIPTIEVRALDDLNNVATDFVSNVTLSIANNAGNGTLSGTAPVTAFAGVAVFSGLSIDKSGVGYTLSASGGGLADTSDGFNITPDNAVRIAFTTPPVTTAAGQPIAPAVQVTAFDGFDNVAAGFTGDVSVALAANPAGGSLSGTTVATALAGVATFPTLNITRTGTGYTLAAASGSLGGDTSGAFGITPGLAAQLEFIVQPANQSVNLAIAPPVQVRALDAHGNFASGFGGDVTMAIGNNAGGGALSGVMSAPAVAGIATFGDLRIDQSGSGYTLRASGSGLTTALSNPFDIVPSVLTRLVFTVAPTDVTAGAPFAPAVRVEALDALDHIVPGFIGDVTLAIDNNPGGANLLGTATVAAVAGVATFDVLSVDKVGAAYTLSASASGAPSVTSAPFTVTPGAPSQLAFSDPPVNAAAGATLAPVGVTVRDAHGNTASDFSGDVTIAIAANPGSGVLSGTATVAAVAGVATFSDLSINKSGAGYTLAASAGVLPAVTSGAFDILPGAATQLMIATSPGGGTAGAALAPALQVEARDALGNLDPNFSGDVTVTIASNPGGGTLGGTATAAAAAGVATFADLTINKSGTAYALAAAATGLDPDTSAAFNIVAGAATKLVFKAQPVPATAGAPIAPAVEVAAHDAFGNIDLSFTGEVAVAITPGSGTAGAVLSGATPVAAVNGVAQFATLNVDLAGGGYRLDASAQGLAGVTSSAFTVSSTGVATQIVFTAVPAAATAGVAFTPAVQVEARDGFGNLVSTFSGDITVAIANNPGSGNLSGTNIVAAVGGVATFDGLSIDKPGVGYTLSAATGGLPHDTSSAFSVVSGPAAAVIFTTPPVGATAGDTLAPVQLTVRDSLGNTVTGFTGDVTLAFGSNPGNATLLGTTTVVAVAGVATFDDLRINTSGTGYTLAASAGALPVATSAPFDIAAGAATKLVVTASPDPATAGTMLTPVVRVAAQDPLGNTDPDFTGQVTLAITDGTGTAGATLSGTKVVAAVNGVASFADLSIDKSGTGFTLSATATGLSGATSAQFNVATGPATQVVFAVPPTNAVAGVAIAPAVQVAVRDDFGNTVTGFTGDVTVSIVANPGSGTLSGATTVAAVDGVATFPGLSINKSGLGYTLQASSGALPAVTSPSFNIVAGAATHLAFTVSPDPATAGAQLTPVVQVAAQDDLGNTDLTFAGDVVVAITPATGTAGATLSGTKTVAAVNGVAEFSALSIDSAGTGYTLTAATTGLTSGISAAFAVAAGPAAQLAFTVQPVDVGAGQALTPAVQVTARDALGNVATSFTGDVAMTLAVNPGAGTLGGTTTLAAVAGVATFGDLSVDRAGSGYRLQATAGVLTSPLSAPFVVATGSAARVVFTQSPTVAEAGVDFTPPVQVVAQDSLGNQVTSFAGNVTVAFGNNPTGATLAGIKTLAAIDGVATFPGLDINLTGTGYTLTASASGLASDTSPAFDVVTPTAAALAFTTQPGDGTAGATLSTIRVTARNASGQTLTSFTDDVTLTILTNPGGGTLSGATTVQAVAGVATFTGLSINKSGAGYRLEATSGTLSTKSMTFDIIAGPPTQLVFFVQPSNAAIGAAITPQVEVGALDAQGNRATGFSGTVTLTIANNPGSGTLGGTTTVPASGGVAIFTNLSLTAAGTGYTLLATDGGAAPDTSAAFDITNTLPNKLAFTVQPSDAVAGVAIAPAVQVTAQNGSGQTLASYNGPVNLSITAGSAREGAEGATLFGTTTVNAVNGVATLSDLSITIRSSGYRLSATATGFAGATSSSFTISPAAAARLDFAVHPDPGTPIAAGAVITPAYAVWARDSFGNRVADFAAATTLAIVVNPGGGSLSGTTTVTPDSGTARFADLSIDRSGSGYRLAATSAGLAADTSPSLSITPLAASELIFTVQPSNVVRGINISPSVRVTARDSLGNVTTSFNGDVTIGIANNPAGGGVLGVATVTAVNGVAIFANLSIDKAGAGYTLSATATGLTSATSTPFDVLPGGGNQLVFAVQPSDAAAGVAIAPPILVQVLDAQGALNTGFSGTVTLSIISNPGNGQLMGAFNAPVVSGVAAFSNVSIDKVGVGYTIRASVTGPTLATTSAPFDITEGAASKLAFTVQPTNAVAGVAISPAVQVTVRDAFNNTVTAFVGDVTVAIANNAGSGTLSGSLTAAVVNGVATFADLSIDKIGVGYTLSATSGSLTGATSVSFDISAAGVSASQSTIAADPTTIAVSSGSATITVTARDQFANPIAGATVVLAATGTGNTLPPPGGNTDASGIATSTLSSTDPGDKVVSATINGVAITQTATVTVTP